MAHILLIEDETRLRETLAELLELFNHTVITAVDGLDGLNKLNTEKPDVILCDIMMPNLNGLEFLIKFKSYNIYQNIPVLLLSAKVDTEDVNEGLKLGATDYIKKPFVIADLINAIDKHLLKKDNK